MPNQLFTSWPTKKKKRPSVQILLRVVRVIEGEKNAEAGKKKGGVKYAERERESGVD